MGHFEGAMLHDFLVALAAINTWRFGNFLRLRWDTHKAPLFVTWREALEWAKEHPGQLARSADGATVRAGRKP